MKEYIEREAVEKMLENAQIITYGEWCGYCTDDVNLDSIPAADVAPVRHAVKAESTISKTGLMCTACYSDADVDAVYCKYCGALMDGKEE